MAAFLKKGIEIIKQAIQLENDEQFEEAYKFYRTGVQYLMAYLKYANSKNPTIVARVKEKVIKYSKRALTIKDKKSTKLESAQNNEKTEENNPIMRLTDSATSSIIHNLQNIAIEVDNNTMLLVFGYCHQTQSFLPSNIPTELITLLVLYYFRFSPYQLMEQPTVNFSDVAGLQRTKQILKESIVLPIAFPQLFSGKRQIWKGILLYGPAGCGKSLLVKAAANEGSKYQNKIAFFKLSGTDLIEITNTTFAADRFIRTLYECARQYNNSIIFIAECDMILTSTNKLHRLHGVGEEAMRRLKTELLVQMQGVGKNKNNVFTILATDCPWNIPRAVRRRMNKRIYVPMPDKDARSEIFKIHMEGIANNLCEEDFAILSEKTNGYTAKEIVNLIEIMVDEEKLRVFVSSLFGQIPFEILQLIVKYVSLTVGVLNVIKECQIGIDLSNVLNVLKNKPPLIPHEQIQRYERWKEEFGSY